MMKGCTDYRHGLSVRGGDMRFHTVFYGNLRRRKKTLIVIALLCTVVCAAVGTAYILMTNSQEYLQGETERLESGDIIYWLSGAQDYNALVDEVSQSDLAERAEIQPLIFSGYSLNGTHSDNEGQLIPYQRDRYSYRFIKYEMNGCSESVSIGENEIYVSPALVSGFDAKLGDTITFELSRTNDRAEYIIAGFYEDPIMGSSMIDMKGFLISEKAYEKLTERIEDIPKLNVLAKNGAMLHLFANDDNLSSDELGRTLRQQTNIGRYTEFMHTKETLSGFMLLLANVLSGFMFGFAAVLLIICIVIVTHTISFTIGQEKTDIGILKAMGCTGGFIKGVYLCEYGLAAAGGLAFGLLLSFPTAKFISAKAVTSLGIIVPANPSVVFIAVFSLIWLAVMAVIIILPCRGLDKITPVNAILDRNDSRVKAAKKALDLKRLTPSLAVRELMSGKMHYIAVYIIAAFLTAFGGIVLDMNGWLGKNGEGLMDAFSAADHDIGFQPKTAVDMQEVESIIQGYDSISEIYGLAMQSAAINGSDCTANIIDNVDKFHIISGRKPSNPNEIVITKSFSESLDIAIGDNVTVDSKGNNAVFHISGIYQCANEMGANIGMGEQGYQRLADTDGYIWCYHYILKDGSRNEKILKTLQERFKLQADIHTNSWSGLSGIVGTMHLLTAFMYAAAAVFILAAVGLQGGKMLAREQKDMAILKSLGMTASRLRLGFTVRISMAAMIGSAIGAVICIISADTLISGIMESFGIGEFISENGVMFAILSALSVCLLFGLFAYSYSRRIKTIPITLLTSQT